MPPVYCATERSTLATVVAPHTGLAPSRYFLAHSTSCSCSMPTPASTIRSGRLAYELQDTIHTREPSPAAPTGEPHPGSQRLETSVESWKLCKCIRTTEVVLRLQTTDYILKTTDYRLKTTDYRLKTTDDRLKTNGLIAKQHRKKSLDTCRLTPWRKLCGGFLGELRSRMHVCVSIWTPPQMTSHLCLLILSSLAVSSELSLEDVFFSPRDQTVSEGEGVFFQCVSGESSPPPSITWLKDGTLVSRGRHIQGEYGGGNQKKTSGTLHLSNVTLEDDGIYTCVTHSPSLNISKESRPAKLSVQGVPRRLQIIQGPDNITVAMGTEVSMRCAVRGFPVPMVHWFKDGCPLSNCSSSFSLQNNGQLLTFRNVTREDEGWYHCEVSNQREATTSQPAFLLPAEMEWSFIQQPANLTVKRGEHVTVTCRPPHSRPAAQVSWFKNNQLLTPTAHQTVLPSGDLFFHSVQEYDNGSYFCRASNIHLQRFITSRRATLTVLAPPSVRLWPQVSTVSVGARVVLECQVSGNPSPTISWMKRGHSKQTGGKIVVGLRNATLYFQSARSFDEGVYVCEASNALGSSRNTAMLRVAVSPIIVTFVGQVSCRIGAPAVLPCRAVGILPITYTWTRVRAERPSRISLTEDRHIDGSHRKLYFNPRMPKLDVMKMELFTFPVCSLLMSGNITVLLRIEQDDIRDVASSLLQTSDPSTLDPVVPVVHQVNMSDKVQRNTRQKGDPGQGAKSTNETELTEWLKRNTSQSPMTSNDQSGPEERILNDKPSRAFEDDDCVAVIEQSPNTSDTQARPPGPSLVTVQMEPTFEDLQDAPQLALDNDLVTVETYPEPVLDTKIDAALEEDKGCSLSQPSIQLQCAEDWTSNREDNRCSPCQDALPPPSSLPSRSPSPSPPSRREEGLRSSLTLQSAEACIAPIHHSLSISHGNPPMLLSHHVSVGLTTVAVLGFQYAGEQMGFPIRPIREKLALISNMLSPKRLCMRREVLDMNWEYGMSSPSMRKLSGIMGCQWERWANSRAMRLLYAKRVLKSRVSPLDPIGNGQSSGIGGRRRVEEMLCNDSTLTPPMAVAEAQIAILKVIVAAPFLVHKEVKCSDYYWPQNFCEGSWVLGFQYSGEQMGFPIRPFREKGAPISTMLSPKRLVARCMRREVLDMNWEYGMSSPSMRKLSGMSGCQW
ncbi:Hemicentin-1 [Liparis tanakae]|uniref:Hemicentin-1 n=1 Tax=Liparis tanakae TaxID=230148 RepID=A0A4Z2H2T0_9TELE|nr:Hemicentin-1 [Liparis tanakae]